MRGILCLEDGFFVKGELLCPGRVTGNPVSGEVVFFTGMTGYEDALTDPSYCGQILVFSFPMIGNYRIPPESGQSGRFQVRGIVARDVWSGSGRESWKSLQEIASSQNCPILAGVDTRKLVLHLREHGSKKGVMAALEPQEAHNPSPETILRLAQQAAQFDMKGVTAEVCAKEPKILQPASPSRGKCVLMDFGIKRDMLVTLLNMGFTVHVVPPGYPPEEITALHPDFVFLSNGPGDPEDNQSSVQCVRALLGRVPVYGICLGHQILALAAGARIKKLKYGHHGANHPVKDLETGRVFITSQNHNFAVDDADLPLNITITHRNLNDGTVEGMRLKDVEAASVQFHPEGAPGPRTSWFWNIIEPDGYRRGMR